jgi:hypothetical protein
MPAERAPGYYWVRRAPHVRFDISKGLEIAHWTRHGQGVWEIVGLEQMFPDNYYVVIAGPLVVPGPA